MPPRATRGKPRWRLGLVWHRAHKLGQEWRRERLAAPSLALRVSMPSGRASEGRYAAASNSRQPSLTLRVSMASEAARSGVARSRIKMDAQPSNLTPSTAAQ